MYNRTLFIASGRGREKTVLSPTTGEYINETRGRFAFSVHFISQGNIWHISRSAFALEEISFAW